jgi:hypothetical protein
MLIFRCYLCCLMMCWWEYSIIARRQKSIIIVIILTRLVLIKNRLCLLLVAKKKNITLFTVLTLDVKISNWICHQQAFTFDDLKTAKVQSCSDWCEISKFQSWQWKKLKKSILQLPTSSQFYANSLFKS